MKICTKCKGQANRLVKGMCGKCYQREAKFKDMKVYDLPPKGEIRYTNEGDVICHICGRAFARLLTHVRQYHEMSEKEYKREYGLILYKGIISEKSRDKSRKAVELNYDKVVGDNLINKGKSTRFKLGDEGRTKNKISMQEMNRLKQKIIIKKER